MRREPGGLARVVGRCASSLSALALAYLAACGGSPGGRGGPTSGGSPGPGAPGGARMISYETLLATPAPPADAREAYGADPLQHGELRLPASAGRAPIVVLVHGGCWRAEYDLRYVAAAAEALAREGFAVWVPEYRRLGNPGGGWPGTFEDIARAVDHVRALAARHPVIDTARVILAGHSAGGQLALWAASRRAREPGGVQSGEPLRAIGVLGLAAITDLAVYGARAGGCNASVTPLLGGTPAEVPDRYRAVSPAERLPLDAAVRLVAGGADAIVPVEQGRSYVERARRAGARAELDVVSGAGHFDVVAPQSAAWAAVVAALRALARPGGG